MEKKIVFTADMKGSDDVLLQMASLRDENTKLTNEQKVRQKAEQKGITITKEERKEFEKRAVTIKENRDQIRELTKAYQGQEQRVEGLRPKLTKLRKTMQELKAAGKENTQEYKNMRQSAAQLQDQVDKTSAEIKFFADDLAGVKVGVDVMTGLSAGFQGVAGAMALAGIESEEFEKNIQRLAGVMAITNSLQQVGNMLRKEGAIRIYASVVATKAKIVAQKALNFVMSANPIGAVIAALAALVAGIVWVVKNFDKVSAAVQKAWNWLTFWKKSSEEAEEATDDLTEAVESLADAKERLRKEGIEVIKNLEHEIKLMRAQGVAIDEIIQKERELLQEKLKQEEAALKRAHWAKGGTQAEREEIEARIADIKREQELFDATQEAKTRKHHEELEKRSQKEMEEQLKRDEKERLRIEKEQEDERKRLVEIENDNNARIMEEQRLAEKQAEIRERRRREERALDLERRAARKAEIEQERQKLEFERQMQEQRILMNLQTTQALIGNLGALMGADEKAAKFMKALALTEAFVSLRLGLAKTANKGFPQNIPLIAGFLAQTTGILASMKKANPPSAPKLAEGGTIIGGRSHSAGGTNFVGSDGTRFEAEKGEYLAVINKRDSSRAALLDSVNRRHGVPLFSNTTGYFARGGVAMPIPREDFERTKIDDIIRDTVEAIAQIPVVVSERDVTDTQRRVEVYERAGNLD